MKIDKPDKILFLDTETGGINPLKHSLLSIGLVLWKGGEIYSQKEILINDGKLNASKKALEINKIDLENHIKNAVKPKKAIEILLDFIGNNFEETGITIAGHNIQFDINFLKIFFYKNEKSYENIFSHRIIDTSSILYFLYLSGKIKEKKISSDEAFEYFNIKVKKRHSALGDALATAELFNKLISITF